MSSTAKIPAKVIWNVAETIKKLEECSKMSSTLLDEPNFLDKKFPSGNTTVTLMAHEVLTSWQMRKGKRATCQALKEVLEDCGLQSGADLLEEHLQATAARASVVTERHLHYMSQGSYETPTSRTEHTVDVDIDVSDFESAVVDRNIIEKMVELVGSKWQKIARNLPKYFPDRDEIASEFAFKDDRIEHYKKNVDPEDCLRYILGEWASMSKFHTAGILFEVLNYDIIGQGRAANDLQKFYEEKVLPKRQELLRKTRIRTRSVKDETVVIGVTTASQRGTPPQAQVHCREHQSSSSLRKERQPAKSPEPSAVQKSGEQENQEHAQAMVIPVQPEAGKEEEKVVLLAINRQTTAVLDVRSERTSASREVHAQAEIHAQAEVHAQVEVSKAEMSSDKGSQGDMLLGDKQLPVRDVLSSQQKLAEGESGTKTSPTSNEEGREPSRTATQTSALGTTDEETQPGDNSSEDSLKSLRTNPFSPGERQRSLSGGSTSARIRKASCIRLKRGRKPGHAMVVCPAPSRDRHPGDLPNIEGFTNDKLALQKLLRDTYGFTFGEYDDQASDVDTDDEQEEEDGDAAALKRLKVPFECVAYVMKAPISRPKSCIIFVGCYGCFEASGKLMVSLTGDKDEKHWVNANDLLKNLEAEEKSCKQTPKLVVFQVYMVPASAANHRQLYPHWQHVSNSVIVYNCIGALDSSSFEDDDGKHLSVYVHQFCTILQNVLQEGMEISLLDLLTEVHAYIAKTPPVSVEPCFLSTLRQDVVFC